MNILILGPLVFPEEENAECDGQYFQYNTKDNATEACRKDESCDGVFGGLDTPSQLGGDVCEHPNTVFHLCKHLRVSPTFSNAGCFLKKRYGKMNVSLSVPLMLYSSERLNCSINSI